MPDLFNWLLTGQKVNEFTDATTTQFLNPRTGDWARDLLAKFDIPDPMLQQIVQPGTNLGPLRTEVAATTGLRDVSVILPGTHDTASAVLAVPAAGPAEGSAGLVLHQQRHLVTVGCGGHGAGDQRRAVASTTSPTRAVSAARSVC